MNLTHRPIILILSYTNTCLADIELILSGAVMECICGPLDTSIFMYECRFTGANWSVSITMIQWSMIMCL